MTTVTPWRLQSSSTSTSRTPPTTTTSTRSSSLRYKFYFVDLLWTSTTRPPSITLSTVARSFSTCIIVDVEGVHCGDKGRFMEEMRALCIDDRADPNPLLQYFRPPADHEHRRYHPDDFDDTARVETLLVVKASSEKVILNVQTALQGKTHAS
ncbi:hypothetical protein CYMTET_23839 [Cymbomonas tetramitiformis]|uniref:Uncharacterized protein n=1 Tax=Cymbomonas tetramitiformis TaxID=36881 RepID=A0AAE0L0Q1_9CHLO|nr:hypothetical protein CYMTET_23839 [Cymbomonas tetramitiformis]